MIRSCKHCKKEFNVSDTNNNWIANHSRWCDQNPKRDEYRKNTQKAIAAMNAKRIETGSTNHFTKAKLEGMPIPEGFWKGKVGQFLGKKHSEETKVKQKKKALASPHRRLRRKMVEYNGIMLDSTWELELAKRLDELKIHWERPDPIKWSDDNGIIHNYFADFYLKDYNLYLDPKNPYAIKAQKEKLKCLLDQHKNILIIKSIEECKNFNII